MFPEKKKHIYIGDNYEDSNVNDDYALFYVTETLCNVALRHRLADRFLPAIYTLRGTRTLQRTGHPQHK